MHVHTFVEFESFDFSLTCCTLDKISPALVPNRWRTEYHALTGKLSVDAWTVWTNFAPSFRLAYYQCMWSLTHFYARIHSRTCTLPRVHTHTPELEENLELRVCMCHMWEGVKAIVLVKLGLHRTSDTLPWIWYGHSNNRGSSAWSVNAGQSLQFMATSVDVCTWINPV